ncbi:MAG: phosphoribosylanthranilate isomerase [Candidatus Kryptoniota bacterium]
MFVKICGITSIEDAYYCVESGADAIGLNFYPSSKRFVTMEVADLIIREVSPFVRVVGLFVKPDLEQIMRISDELLLDGIQVYEPQFNLYDYSLSKPLYLSIRVKSANDIVAASKLPGDLIFLDTFVEGEYGGTGRAIDHEILLSSGMDFSFKFVISGGLTPENVSEVVRILKPYGVDVASGVEIYPGKKDKEKVNKFIEKAKGII